MIPGLGLGFSGGSSGSDAVTQTDVTGAGGFTVNASKGIDAKTLLVIAVPVVALGALFILKGK